MKSTWEITLFTAPGQSRQEPACTDVEWFDDGTLQFKTEGGDYFRTNLPAICRKEKNQKHVYAHDGRERNPLVDDLAGSPEGD